MTFSKRRWLAAIVLLAIGCFLGWKYRKVVLYSTFILFRGSPCNVYDVATAKANLITGDEVQDVLRSKSHRLQADPAGYELWETPDGRYWDVSAHTVISVLSEQARDIYTNRPYQTIRPGDVVFDCGASIGVFTRKALKAGASKVVAVEPSPDSFECLRRNFAEEIRAGKVVAVRKGVFDHEGRLAFTDNRDGPMGNHGVWPY